MPHLSPSKVAGNLIFLSGQLAFDNNGAIAGDITQQTHRVWSRLDAVLRRHGLSLADVVKCNVWLADAKDFSAFDAAYAAYLGDVKPARSTVISQLALPGALIEIDAIALVPPHE